MKLKTDEQGRAVLSDGKPVFIGSDGKETAIDVAETMTRVSFLQDEARKAFAARDEAKAALRSYEGLDAEAARKALDTVKGLDAKKLIDAGEVEKVKSEISKSFEATIAELKGQIDTRDKALYSEKVSGAFARSPWIKDKIAVPADFVEAKFAQHFKLENGGVVAFDATGNRIYSRARPGQAADFDEAIETLVSSYPDRDKILRGSGAKGPGTDPNANGNGGGARTISRAAFEAMSQSERMNAVVKDGVQVTD